MLGNGPVDGMFVVCPVAKISAVENCFLDCASSYFGKKTLLTILQIYKLKTIFKI